MSKLARAHAGIQQEEIESPKQVGLATISPDVLYAAITQPRKIFPYLIKGEPLAIQNTDVRKITMLINAMVFHKETLDVDYIMEVRPPYDEQTEDFMYHLAEAINKHLELHGEISEEQIEAFKHEVYKARTYTHPFSVLITEMEDNESYFGYLLNSDKMKVSTANLESAAQIAEQFPREILEEYGNQVEYNVTLQKNLIMGLTAYNIVSRVPAIRKHSGICNIYYGVYVPGNIFNQKLNNSLLDQSYIKLNIGLTMKLIKEETLTPNCHLYLGDEYGNTLMAMLSEATMGEITRYTDGVLTSLKSLMSSRYGWKTLVARNKNGYATI